MRRFVRKAFVGTRHHKCGHNYDLCQAAFDQLSDDEKLSPCSMPRVTVTAVTHDKLQNKNIAVS